MGAFSKLQAFIFATLLAKPFPEWDAFKLGLIDEKGNLIKKPVTPEEKSSLNALTNLIRKIKKILVKFLPDSKLLGFIVSAYLLKSESTEPAMVELCDALTENELNSVYSLIDTLILIDPDLPNKN